MSKLSTYLESLGEEGIKGGPVRVRLSVDDGILVVWIRGLTKEAVDKVVETMATMPGMADIIPERGLIPSSQMPCVLAGEEPDWAWRVPMRQHAAIYYLKGNYHLPAENFIPGLPILVKDLI